MIYRKWKRLLRRPFVDKPKNVTFTLLKEDAWLYGSNLTLAIVRLQRAGAEPAIIQSLEELQGKIAHVLM